MCYICDLPIVPELSIKLTGTKEVVETFTRMNDERLEDVTLFELEGFSRKLKPYCCQPCEDRYLEFARNIYGNATSLRN